MRRDEQERQQKLQALGTMCEEWNQRRSHSLTIATPLREAWTEWDRCFAPYKDWLRQTLPLSKDRWYTFLWPLYQKQVEKIQQRREALYEERDTIGSTLPWNDPLHMEIHRLNSDLWRYACGAFSPSGDFPIGSLIDEMAQDGQVEKHVVVWTVRYEEGRLFRVTGPVPEQEEEK